jgi:Zn-dependent protease
MTGGPNYYYTWTPAQPATARLSTSRTELTHLSIAFAVLTVDLVIILTGGGILVRATTGLFANLTIAAVLASAAAAFTGFLCHELAHKVYAQRHGFWAEFRMSPSGLLVSLITSAIGFLWAAPGATVVSGMSPDDRVNWGRTSLAGPATNAAFGLVFYGGAVAAYSAHSAFYPWLVLLAWFNGWFATFNLIPLGPLDGAKVLRWSTGTWLTAILLIGAFTGVAMAVLYGFTTPYLGR